MAKLSIIGAGDLGEQIANLALRNGYEIEGYFDDFMPIGTIRQGGIVKGRIEDIDNQIDIKSGGVIVAIGYKHFKERQAIFEKISGKINIATIINTSVIFCEFDNGSEEPSV